MEAQQDRLGRQLKETKAFSPTSLFFGVLSSVVCTAVIPALGAGVPATLAGAALSPLLGAVITTQGHGLVRTIAIACVCSVAAIVTIGGFTLPELVAGRGSLTGDRDGTFVSTERPQTESAGTSTRTRPPTPTRPPTSTRPPAKDRTVPTGIKVKLTIRSMCARTVVGGSSNCQIGVGNVGGTTIRIASVRLEGDAAGEFRVIEDCDGILTKGTGCVVKVEFRPTAAGVRDAVLAVRVKPGGVTRRIPISGEGTDEEITSSRNPTCNQEPTISPGVTPTQPTCVTPT